MARRTWETENQTINIIQTNNNGCGCGCGTFIGIICVIALVVGLIEEFGPIVTAIPGGLLGFWVAIKVCGYDINTMENIDYNQLNTYQIILLFGGLIIGSIGGYHFGNEFLKELNDNANLITNFLNVT